MEANLLLSPFLFPIKLRVLCIPVLHVIFHLKRIVNKVCVCVFVVVVVVDVSIVVAHTITSVHLLSSQIHTNINSYAWAKALCRTYPCRGRGYVHPQSASKWLGCGLVTAERLWRCIRQNPCSGTVLPHMRKTSRSQWGLRLAGAAGHASSAQGRAPLGQPVSSANSWRLAVQVKQKIMTRQIWCSFWFCNIICPKFICINVKWEIPTRLSMYS